MRNTLVLSFLHFFEFFLLRMLNFCSNNGKIPTIIQLTEVELTTGSIVSEESTVWANQKFRQL